MISAWQDRRRKCDGSVKPEEPEGTSSSGRRHGLNDGEGGGVRWQKKREISRKRGRAKWGREVAKRGGREYPFGSVWVRDACMRLDFVENAGL